jgi:hypothetical protein
LDKESLELVTILSESICGALICLGADAELDCFIAKAGGYDTGALEFGNDSAQNIDPCATFR